MKLKRIGILLSPSLLSGSLTLCISVAILLAATWSYSVGSGAIYNFLFGPNSSTELIRSSRSSISAFSNTVFGNPILNKVLYFAFWMLIGLTVYVILFVFIRGTSSAIHDVEEATYTNDKKLQAVRTIGLRIGLHLLVLVAWTIYWIFFVKILVPFTILAEHTGIRQLAHPGGWLFGLLGLIILTISLHIHVIFLRLLVLRVRLYDPA